MIRNTVFAAAAGFVMFVGVPAQAAALYGNAPIVEDGGSVQNVSHWVQKCKIVRVKGAYGWRNVKKCRKVFPKHYSTY